MDTLSCPNSVPDWHNSVVGEDYTDPDPVEPTKPTQPATPTPTPTPTPAQPTSQAPYVPVYIPPVPSETEYSAKNPAIKAPVDNSGLYSGS